MTGSLRSVLAAFFSLQLGAEKGMLPQKCCRRHAAVRGQPCSWRLGTHVWRGSYSKQECVHRQQCDLQPAGIQVTGAARPHCPPRSCRAVPLVHALPVYDKQHPHVLRISRAGCIHRQPSPPVQPAVATFFHRRAPQLGRPKPARHAASRRQPGHQVRSDSVRKQRMPPQLAAPRGVRFKFQCGWTDKIEQGMRPWGAAVGSVRSCVAAVRATVRHAWASAGRSSSRRVICQA